MKEIIAFRWNVANLNVKVESASFLRRVCRSRILSLYDHTIPKWSLDQKGNRSAAIGRCSANSSNDFIPPSLYEFTLFRQRERERERERENSKYYTVTNGSAAFDTLQAPIPHIRECYICIHKLITFVTLLHIITPQWPIASEFIREQSHFIESNKNNR